MSNLPPNTRDHLYQSGSWSLPGYDDLRCEGAAFHSPRPLFTRDVPLVPEKWRDGSDEQRHLYRTAPRATLCGTCAANIDILLQMLVASDGALDWKIRREFGNTLRALAVKGWTWSEEHRPADLTQPATKG